MFVQATVDSFVPESHPLRDSTIATGTAEREGAIALLDSSVAPRKSHATLGADKGYDARDFFDAIVERNIRPHIALQHTNRKQPLCDKRTTSSRGYQLSQIHRRKVEGIIGWLKHPGRIKQGEQSPGRTTHRPTFSSRHRSKTAARS